jgi:hypothetical protein
MDLLNEFFYDLRRVIPGLVWIILYFYKNLAEGFTQPPPPRYPLAIFAAAVVALAWLAGVVIENLGYTAICPLRVIRWFIDKIVKPRAGSGWAKFDAFLKRFIFLLLPPESWDDFESPEHRRLQQKHIAEKVMFRNFIVLLVMTWFWRPTVPGWSTSYGVWGFILASLFWVHLKIELFKSAAEREKRKSSSSKP